MVTRAHIALPPQTLQALDEAAEQDRRSRSATVQIAVEQFLALRSASGKDRLAALETIAAGQQVPPSSPATAAAAAHLAEHARLSGFVPSSTEDPNV